MPSVSHSLLPLLAGTAIQAAHAGPDDRSYPPVYRSGGTVQEQQGVRMTAPGLQSEAVLTDSIAAALARRVGASLPILTEQKSLRLNLSGLDQAMANEFRLNPLTKDIPAIPQSDVERLRAKIVKDYGSVTVPLACDPQAAPANPDAQYRYVMATPDKAADMVGVDVQARLATHAKWQALKCAIETSGAAVETIDASQTSGGIREVFTRDRYFLLGDTAYLPDPAKYDELKAASGVGSIDSATLRDELETAEDFLTGQGIKTVHVQGAWFEGGNLVPNSASKTIFMGQEPDWDNSASSRLLIDAVNRTQPEKWNVMGVPLVNKDHMFHLDLGMSQQLPRGEHVISPYVTDAETYQAIKSRLGKNNVIEALHDDDAYNYAANLAVASDKNIVFSFASPGLQENLRQKGYNPVLPDAFGQVDFKIQSGGPDCMTNALPSLARPDMQNRGR